LLWPLLALSLAACAGLDDGPGSTPEALAARLPEEAAGLRRGSEALLDQPVAGREIAYATPNRSAAGFVQILSGPAPPDAQAAWVAQSAESGPNRRLRAVGDFTEGPLGCTQLEGNYGRQAVRSTVCAGSIGGKLIRLRLSMPRRDPPAADAPAFVRVVVQSLTR
jgi:hypothetical protein